MPAGNDADPGVLTSRQAGDLLAQRSEEVLRLWEQRVRTAVPAAEHRSRPVLLDSLPDFLQHLVSALRAEQPPPSAYEIRTAREHADQRSTLAGYDLSQVVEEYHQIRSVVLELLEETAPLAPPARRLVDDTVDLALRVAATEYVHFTRAELDRVQNHYRLLVENTRDYAFITFDPHGRILTWSPGAERITGFSAREAIGEHASLLFTPEDRLRGVPEAELVQARIHGRKENERWYVRRDGTRFFGSGVLAALRDGHLVGYAKVMRDATRRKQMEEEQARMHAAEQETRAQAEQTADRLRRLQAVTDVALDHLELDALLRELLRRIRDVLGTDTATILLLEDDALVARAAVGLKEEVLRHIRIPLGEGFAGRIAAERVMWKVPDIKQIQIYSPVLRASKVCSLLGVPLILADEVLGVLHVGSFTCREWDEEAARLLQLVADRAARAIDRSRLAMELQHRAHALVEADRRKDEFLATLAHELRNPLAGISNAMYILERLPDQDPQRSRFRAIVRRQTEHLTRMVDDLLDLSRVVHQKIELRLAQVDLRNVIRQAVDATQAFFETRGHELHVELPPAALLVEGDPTRLEQVFTNLLNNAAKYTPSGGRVFLDARLEEATVTARVRDNGHGIAAELLPQIFDLFTQAERPLDRPEGGLGIGLTLVKRLVELHHGNIEVRSAGPGQGSEFIVRLPVLRPESPAQDPMSSVAAPDSTAPRPGTSDPRLRVLVVEDNSDAAETLAEIIGFWNLEVEVASSGRHALEAARRHPPDVVLLDIGLPGMDGYEVARRLRAEPGLAGMLLIALTGYGQEEDRRRSAQAGFDFHLVKPVDPEELRCRLIEAGRSLLPRA